jgi:hypothetical protein
MVEVNDGDFYECRECHTQYTTFGYDMSWEQKWLYSRGEMIKAVHRTKAVAFPGG